MAVTLFACRRWYSSRSLWRKVFGTRKPQEPCSDATPLMRISPQASPSEHLMKLVQTHMPQFLDNWHQAPLGNIMIKSKVCDSWLGNAPVGRKEVAPCTKILMSCDRVFNRSVPNPDLGAIVTVGDILNFLETKRPQTNPPLFHKEVRPPNLSLQTYATPRIKHRTPFQNYDAPQHATFRSKKRRSRSGARGF